MGIGVSVFLLAVGAVLSFALHPSVENTNLDLGRTPGYWNTVGMTGGRGVEIVLLNLSRPTDTPEGVRYLDFSLEIRYPDKTR